MTSPFPIDLKTGRFLSSAKIENNRYTKITVKKLWEKDRWNSFSASKMGYNMEQIATMRISKSGRRAPKIIAGNSRLSYGMIRRN